MDMPRISLRNSKRLPNHQKDPGPPINDPGEVSDESYPHRTTQGPERTPVARGTVAGPADPGIARASGARADRAFRKGVRDMIAWAGLRLWLAARTVIRAVTMAHDEQVRMWECVLLTSGAAPLTAACPLRWVPSLGGYRLIGSHLPARTRAKRGGNPSWRPRAKIPAPASPAIRQEHPSQRTAASRRANPALMGPTAPALPTSGPRHRRRTPGHVIADSLPIAGLSAAARRAPRPRRRASTSGSCAPSTSTATPPAKNPGGGIFVWRWDIALPETRP